MTDFHVMAGAGGIAAAPRVRTVTMDDLFDALRGGFEDFWAKPSHIVFLGLI